MVVLSLFDGMSCGRIALERAGFDVEKYYASEVDQHAITVSKKNYPDNIHLGSVVEWKTWDIDWDSIDLIIGGSPCQGFSLSGKQLAFDDPRSMLYFVFEDIINEANPSFWMLENVRMKPEHLDTITERLGVSPQKINSNLVSGQNRVRYYWFNWNAPEPADQNITLQDVIQDAKGVWVYPRGYNKGGYRKTDKCPTITTSSWQSNFKWFDESGYKHKFTPEDVEALQTVPNGYTQGVSNTQRYKMLGNGWTVDVISHILKHCPSHKRKGANNA